MTFTVKTLLSEQKYAPDLYYAKLKIGTKSFYKSDDQGQQWCMKAKPVIAWYRNKVMVT